MRYTCITQILLLWTHTDVDYLNRDRMWTLRFLLIGILAVRSGVAVTVETGQNVTLECPLEGTFPEWFGPPAFTALTNGSEVTADGMEFVNDTHLMIINVTTVNMGNYRCKLNNNEVNVDLIVTSYNYIIRFNNVEDISVPLEAVTSVRAIAARVNDEVMLNCTVANAFPKPDISISIPDSNVSIASTDITHVPMVEEDKSITVTATVTIPVSRDLDMKSVVCTATSSDRSRNATEVIRVIVPATKWNHAKPRNHSPSIRSGDYVCDSKQTWPSVTITWKVGGSETIPARFEAFPTQCNQGQDLLFNCSSRLHVAELTKADNGMLLTCEYIFMGERENEKNFTVNFKFPPTQATITSPTITEEGENVTLTCSTDSANDYDDNLKDVSGVTFSWKVGTENINVTETNRTETPGENNGFDTSQTVSFPVTRHMHGRTVTCQARNSFTENGSYVSDSKTLNISYSPEIVVPFGTIVRVYMLDRLVLTCVADSNPPANVTWSYQDAVLETVDSDPDDNTLAYIVDQAQSTDAGEYTCMADNGMSPSVSKLITVIVHEKPPNPQFFADMVEDESASIKFETSAEPPAIPRSFYIQYKLSTHDQWLEIDRAFPDTIAGEQARTIEVPLTDLLQGTTYHIRLKSVDHNGLSYYTSWDSFTTSGNELTKTEAQYRNAVLISVFVTFGIMLIILVISVYLMRKGSCGSTSKGIDLVAM